MIGYLYLVLAILGTSIGQILLKKYSLQKKRITIDLFFALLLLGLVPIFIYLSLRHISFLIVFIADALAIAMVVLMSKIALKENLNKNKITGILLIVIGILILKWKMI